MTTDEIQTFINENRWVFAKTMAQNPHEYLLRKRTSDVHRFDRFVDFINANGELRSFWKRTYVYLDFDGMSYWSMPGLDGKPLINRAKIQEKA